jgi:hypothetical protein
VSPSVDSADVDRQGGLLVVGAILRGLKDAGAEIFLFAIRPPPFAIRRLPFAICLLPLLQRSDGRRRAGHDAAQQRQRPPVAHALPSFVQLLAGVHRLGAEGVGFLEQIAVGRREGVGLVGRFADGEAMRAFPVLLDVPARALDEMLRQHIALRFGQRAGVPCAEVGVEQGEQGAKGPFDAAVRRGRQQHQMPIGLLRQRLHQAVPLLLFLFVRVAGGAAVRLVHDDELRRIEEKAMAVALALDEVNADHLHGVMLVDALRDAAFELADRPGADDHCLQVELLGQLPLPLIAQVGRAQHTHPPDLAAVEQLAGDQQRFDRLAHAHVVGDQQADWVQPQRHQQGHELIEPRADGDAAQGAEGRGAFAQGQPRRLPQQARADGVGDVVRFGRGKGRAVRHRGEVVCFGADRKKLLATRWRMRRTT